MYDVIFRLLFGALGSLRGHSEKSEMARSNAVPQSFQPIWVSNYFALIKLILRLVFFRWLKKDALSYRSERNGMQR